ncbi:hypothetical protein [Mangrovicoccus algicola]|uniref:LamG domain-containing protein n=1 Tax=Mangrovicoccus algicola TaxID=2771008 RepID=A0A8J6Z7P7_9RHOB|nr:hypothetical protein [Mangrovicoccus algicola]MBE3639504.1 hypothetical protein [Mangrovicoccus algicola]
MALMIALGMGSMPTLTIAGSATVGSVLQAAGMQISGTSPITYNIQWYRNGTAISGARSTLYDTAGESAGAVLRVSVTSGGTRTDSQEVTLTAAAAVPSGGQAMLDAMPVAPAFFDSGAAFGRNAATLPLAGDTDAADGAVIEGRLVRADTGAEVSPWSALGTAQGGRWSGSYAGVARSPHSLRAEVRVAGSPEPAVRGAEDIMIGHVIVLIGQSEEAYMFGPSLDGGTPEPVADPAALHVMTHRTDGGYAATASEGAYAANGIMAVTTATPRTSSMAALSNFLAANAPGDRFLLVDASVAGTSYWNLASDDPAAAASEQSDRDWTDSFAGAVELLRSYGAEPGLLMSTWTAAPATTNDGYRQRLYPLFTGRYAPEQGGADYVPGQDALNGRPYDHLFFDLTGRGLGLLDPDRTKAYFYGPHRFELTQANATKQDTRISIRNLADDGLPSVIDVVGPEMVSYENGFQATGSSRSPDRAAADGWVDVAHPSRFSSDGAPRRARFTALAALYGLGIGPEAAQARDVPRLNRAYWEPSGSYAEFWFEAADGTIPPITTTRLARGEAAIPRTLAGTASASQAAIGGAELPHRAEVAGFEIDGDAAQNAVIADGRIRVYPNGGSFTGNTRIDFLRGGASGIHSVPGLADADVIQADLFDRIWMNLPVVTGMVEDVEGIPLRPMPEQGEIAPDLAAAPQFATDGTTAIYDSANWGATTPITARFRLSATPAGTGEEALLRLPTGPAELKLSLINGDGLRYKFGPGGIAADVASPVPYAGAMREFVITADPAVGAFGVYVDGIRVAGQESGAGGSWSGAYPLRLLGLSNGAGLLHAAVESITIWSAYSPDGAAPATAPYKQIEGDAAAAMATAKAGPHPFVWYRDGAAQ